MIDIDSSDNFSQDFKKSAISEDVVALNICILGDTSHVAEGQDLNEDLDFLIDRLRLDGGSKEDRNNPGRISDSSLKYARKMCGGWYNAPFYGLAEKAVTDYFYFKPKVAPKDYKGKPIKYIGAIGVPSRLMTPNVPDRVCLDLATKYEIDPPDDPSTFWQWVLDNLQIPVLVGEGFKKSLAGISCSFATAGINGCNGGYITEKEDDGTLQDYKLVDDLKVLAQRGRTIYLALDRDSIGKTKRTVQRATKILAGLLSECGCTVYSIKWDCNKYKGLDDFIAKAGIEALKLAVENATNITPQPKPEKDEGKNKLPPLPEIAAVVGEHPTFYCSFVE